MARRLFATMLAVLLGTCTASPVLPFAWVPSRLLANKELLHSGWTDLPEPPGRCHQTLLASLETCCWMEWEHRTFQELHNAEKLYTRWACTTMDGAYNSCEDLAHRYSYPGSPRNVHLCKAEYTEYTLYRLDMAILLSGLQEGTTQKLTSDMLDEVDTAVKRAVATMKEITETSVVVAEGAKIQPVQLPSGTFEDGCVMSIHFQADDAMSTKSKEAIASNSPLASVYNMTVANIAMAVDSRNALNNETTLADHILASFRETSGSLAQVESIEIKVTTSTGIRQSTYLMVGSARKSSCFGLLAFLSSVLISMGASGSSVA